jgi:PAS domain S-box-containing protein
MNMAERLLAKSIATVRQLDRATPYVALIGALFLALLALRLGQPQIELAADTHLFIHNVVETFSIVVCALIFALGWNASRDLPMGRISVLAFAFLAVALLDFFHMLSYFGMPALVTPAGPEKAIAFWLMARFMAALGLLAFALLSTQLGIGTTAKWLTLAGTLIAIFLATLVVLYVPHWLPRTFIAGEGLTPFKVIAEYLLVALYVSAGALILTRRDQTVDAPSADQRVTLFTAAFIAAMSEVFFTFYASVYDVYNVAGHVYKVIAYYFVYRGLFVESVQVPYRTASDLRMQLYASEDHWHAADAARGASESQLQSIVDTAMDAIIAVDEDQRIVLFNRAAEKIFGCDAAAAIGAPLEHFLPARFRHAHRAHVDRFGATSSTERAMGGGRTLYGLRANGEEFPIDASISSTTSQGKRLYTVILRDITATVHLQDELRLAEQRWRQALDAGPHGVFEWNASTGFYRSEHYLGILGRSNEEVAASPNGWRDFIHPDDWARAARVSPRSGSDIPDQYTEEFRILTPDGSERWIAASGLVTSRDAQGLPQRLIGTVTDVTERHRTQRMLRELAAREQSEVEDERKRIARALHDELGQTLTALRLDLAETKNHLGDAARARQLIARMDHLVDTAVSETRRVINALRPQLLDDLGVAAATGHLVAQTRERLGIYADFQEEGDLAELPGPLQLTLYRITQEALNNIAKHAKAGSVEVRLTRTDGEVRLDIRDDGQGFATTMPHKAGSFGLFGMQERAMLLGGKLTVQSTPGEGTTISARFPV